MSKPQQNEPPLLSRGHSGRAAADQPEPPRLGAQASLQPDATDGHEEPLVVAKPLAGPQLATTGESVPLASPPVPPLTAQLETQPHSNPLASEPPGFATVPVPIPIQADSSAQVDPSVVAREPMHVEVHQGTQEEPEQANAETGGRRRWFAWPFYLAARGLDVASLLVLLAVVAAIPIIQLASLGYLLQASARLADGRPWRDALPGHRLAGKLGTYFLLATLLWLPVWFVTDLAYSVQLMRPGSGAAAGWRIGAFVITGVWITHIGWAAMRGGRWWHLVWPAPLRFMTQIWRPSTWSRAADRLFDLVSGLQFPQLWWLGLRAAVGALIWIVLPVSLMIIGLRAYDLPLAGLIGFVGAAMMVVVMLYLPFLQIQLARENRFRGILRVRTVRRRFRYAPWAHAVSLLLLVLLCIPLYLLRIEATPAELLWAPSLVFALFMLPAKLLLGASMGYGERRLAEQDSRPRHWSLRLTARLVTFASALVYLGALYVAQLVAGEGAFVMYFQHAFLIPAPLISS